MDNVSEPHDIFFLIFKHMCSIDLLIDKQELIKKKVLKVNGLCRNDTMGVSTRRQFESKFFGFRTNSERFSNIIPFPSDRIK